MPTHLAPALADDHIRPMCRVFDVMTHPLGERVMAREERWIVTARTESGRLHLRSDIEQADRQSVQAVGRWRGNHLACRNGVTAQQEVTTRGLGRQRAAHSALDGLMAPLQRPLRLATELGQFGGLENIGELRCDSETDGGLAGAAGARD